MTGPNNQRRYQPRKPRYTVEWCDGGGGASGFRRRAEHTSQDATVRHVIDLLAADITVTIIPIKEQQP